MEEREGEEGDEGKERGGNGGKRKLWGEREEKKMVEN